MEEARLTPDQPSSSEAAFPPHAPTALRSGEHGEMGRRRSMEDAIARVEDVDVSGRGDDGGPLAFYVICDGHGGSAAAEYVSKYLVKNITADERFRKDPSVAMRDAFSRTDAEFKSVMDADECSGSTALALCVSGSECFVANAGDCRAVLSRHGTAIDLSADQRPSTSVERARIEAAGGYVEDGYINGHLGVARAFGDFHIDGLKGGADGKPGPLIVTPEVETRTLTTQDEFIVLACDGLWDVFSSQNAIDFTRIALRGHNDPEIAARELCNEALRRDSADNVSVIVVCLSRDKPPDKATEHARIAPPRSQFSRTISNEGLSELQRALKSDNEAAKKSPGLQRVRSINPHSGGGGGGEGLSLGHLSNFSEELESLHVDGDDTMELSDDGIRRIRRHSVMDGSGGGEDDHLSPLVECPETGSPYSTIDGDASPHTLLGEHVGGGK